MEEEGENKEASQDKGSITGRVKREKGKKGSDTRCDNCGAWNQTDLIQCDRCGNMICKGAGCANMNKNRMKSIEKMMKQEPYATWRCMKCWEEEKEQGMTVIGLPYLNTKKGGHLFPKRRTFHKI